MKKWGIISVLVLVFFAVAYWFIFRFAVPRMSEAFIPYQWKQVPLGQKRNVVLNYLGSPNKAMPLSDEWKRNVTGEKFYILSICYNKDTIASAYKLSYTFEFFGMKNESVLREERDE